jgi:hypothetical protein
MANSTQKAPAKNAGANTAKKAEKIGQEVTENAVANTPEEGAEIAASFAGENLDVTFTKEADGDFEFIADGEKKDVTIKKEDGVLTLDIEFESGKTYHLEAKCKKLGGEGKKLRVGGAVAKILLQKGLAKLIK